jgi:hypothetical protein
LLFWSCKSDSHSPYAIKDFRKELQPYLTQLVTKGLVHYGDSLQKYATDKELEQLVQSEHPILRMAALREMLYRKSFDHFKVIMDHLNDTALVPIAIEEGGIRYKYVSDDMIENARWKSEADKNKTIDAVITKHNYLRAAYTILDSLPPQEKYYAYIKEMAIRWGESDGSYIEPDIANYQYALYGLAKFKKKEDIAFIKQMILNNTWRIGSLDFQLMQEFPDTAYLAIFEKLYPFKFYQSFCTEGMHSMAADYIQSIAVYKQPRSAKILDSILNNMTILCAPVSPHWLRKKVAHAIWITPCEAYANLRKQVKKEIKEFENEPGNLFIEIPWIKDSLSKIEEGIAW